MIQKPITALESESIKYEVFYKLVIAAARARGHFGGRPPVDKLAMEKAQKLYYTRQYTISEITQLTGITKPTLYRYINKTDSAS